MQTSMFGSEIRFPHTYQELESLYAMHIKQPGEDPDAFTWNDLSGKGRSYSFYGQKIFEYIPGDQAKLRLPGWILRILAIAKPDMKDSALYVVGEREMSENLLLKTFSLLADQQKKIFRNTITEEFGCCHDFIKCSDAKACLHPEDRFYNGCQYRRNLEAGKIFYGKNRNTDGKRK